MKIILPLFFVCITIASVAQTPGTLDSGFGNNGKAILNNKNVEQPATALLVLPDKKIIIGGSTRDFAFACLLPDGALNRSFGENGYVKTNFIVGDKPNSDSKLNSFALAADGKILAGGKITNRVRTDDNIIIARYLSNGILDSSFGFKGAAIADAGSLDDECISVLIQPDKKILAVGNTNGKIFLARFSSKGKLDLSFGINGIVLFETGSYYSEYCITAALQKTGKIVVASRIDQHPFSLVRFNADGQVDSSFGKKGIVIDKRYNKASLYALSMLVQNDDKIILGGYSQDNKGRRYPVLVRYLQNGNHDNTFGDTGFVSGIEKRIFFYALAQQQNNKIIAAGTQEDKYGNEDILISRYLTNGTVDSTFGTNGFTINDFHNNRERISSLAIQNDTKIVAGIAYNFNTPAVFRYFGNEKKQLATSALIDHSNAVNIKISPNPVISQLLLTGLPANEKSLLIITDLRGNIRMQRAITSANYLWNLSQLSNGIYVLHVQVKNKELTSINLFKE
ncbi:MAG: T9SS type A sorting domain-containing protein [Parafilimonas sp.]